MNKEKIYILQKDSPNCDAGMEFCLVGIIEKYQSMKMNKQNKPIYFEAEEVENNSEWFKLKEEVKPTIISFTQDYDFIRFYLNIRGVYIILKERLAEILILESKNELMGKTDCEGNAWYTEKEYLQFGEDCWDEAREHLSYKGEYRIKHKSFSDFMNLKQKK